MIEILREARVAAPVGQVWQVVSDPDRAPDWFSFADRIEVVSGDGVGQRRLQHGRWGHQRAEVDQEVTEFEPNRVIAWRHTAERLDGKPARKFAASTEFRVELVDEGTGTLVRMRCLQQATDLFHAVAMRMFMTREIVARMTESLARLERAVASD